MHGGVLGLKTSPTRWPQERLWQPNPKRIPSDINQTYFQINVFMHLYLILYVCALSLPQGGQIERMRTLHEEFSSPATLLASRQE